MGGSNPINSMVIVGNISREVDMRYDCEVLTRRPCDVQECKHGRIIFDAKRNVWDHCSNCKGKGYVESWMDLRELIKDIMR